MTQHCRIFHISMSPESVPPSLLFPVSIRMLRPLLGRKLMTMGKIKCSIQWILLWFSCSVSGIAAARAAIVRIISWSLLTECKFIFSNYPHPSYPGRHAVGVRIAVVEVEDEDSEEDAAGNHAHDKVEISSCIEHYLSSQIGAASNKRIVLSFYLLREQHRWLLASAQRQYYRSEIPFNPSYP